MTDDVRTLTARLAEEPGSLAFLELGETLRRRGQLDAAFKVARGGLSRYPRLVDAHDLLARILCDRGELPEAFDAWAEALRIDPMHPSALKGVAFLYFRAGDLAAARQFLERAFEADPDDPAIPAALGRLVVSAAGTKPTLPEQAVATAAPMAAPSDRAEAAATRSDLDAGMVLADGQGMRLRGQWPSASNGGGAAADAVAAELAGAAKEAGRMARVLELGAWESVTVESPGAHLVILPPTAETTLLVAVAAGVPLAQLHRDAARAAEAVRTWLERDR